jgi:iron complex outermembrane receptor protein
MQWRVVVLTKRYPIVDSLRVRLIGIAMGVWSVAGSGSCARRVFLDAPHVTTQGVTMLNLSNSWARSSLIGSSAMVALSVGAFGTSVAVYADDQPSETIVVTDTKFNTDVAPAKASLDTTEPQTIINRSYIQNFVPPQADYVTILAIVPSMTGGDANGPGLSDGGAKNTLRGLPDGDFAMQYDGIPFGDTNGPTHHNISYFPASTIGSLVVDRGPGNAGNLGAATYGGTIKMFSQTLSYDPQVTATASGGSFGLAFSTPKAVS